MWPRSVAAVLACAACGSPTPGGSHKAVVVAYAGTQPEAGVTVVGHAPDGTIIDEVTADAVGRAEVGVDDDSLVSVVFGKTIAATASFSVITAPAPAEGAELVVYGPKRAVPPLIVGVLQLDGPNLNQTDYFDVTLGCATVRVTSLPATIDVGSCSLGTDQNLDVLVRGYQDLGGDPPAPMLLGYAAGRTVFASGVATLDLPAWQTSGPVVPIVLDGVTPSVDWTLHVDGLDFVSQSLTGQGQLFANLMVDATTIQAVIPASGGARVTVREMTGTPATIALAAGDFLPGLEAFTQRSAPFGASWPAVASGADAVNFHASWTIGSIDTHRVVWEAVLAPDATEVTFPSFGGTLGEYLQPVVVVPIDLVLRHVDSSDVDGFAGLTAVGLHAEERLSINTIAPTPVNGQLRTSHVIGGQ